MIYIILSVLVNTLLFIIFKLFDKYKVDTFQAIVVNYFFAFAVANWTSDSHFSITQTPKEDWFWGAVFLGFLFITIFNVLAKTAQKLGLSVVAVASKMSVVIPVLFGLFIYHETAGLYKITGIILALVAVCFTSVNESKTFNKSYIYLPIILFLGSGTLDATLKYVEKMYVAENETKIYTSVIFLTAFILGVLFLGIQLIIGKAKLKMRNFYAGIILGVPNFYSIYFLLKALQTKGLESSTLFTINNVSIVLFSTVVGFLLFKEKLSKKNVFGIALAIISIILITFSV